MHVPEFVPSNAWHSCGLAGGIENAPKQVLSVERAALFVGIYQRVGRRAASLLLPVLRERGYHLRSERKVSDAARSLRRTEVALVYTLANM
jgi:hypothetical protein